MEFAARNAKKKDLKKKKEHKNKEQTYKQMNQNTLGFKNEPPQ